MSAKHNPVNWFEIPVSDLSRAKTFYEAIFKTTLTDMEMGPAKMAMFSWEKDATGATGGLMLCDGFPAFTRRIACLFHSTVHR